MERLRKSFRRKKHKDAEEIKNNQDNVEASSINEASIEECEPSASLHKDKVSRLSRIRQSFRRKKKKQKSSDETKQEETRADSAEQLDIEPFDKRSKFRRSLSFKKKKKKPTKYESDEDNVRNSRCSFAVKYLGSLEVEESRGMEVCEAAVKHLRKSKKDPVSAILHVSGDGLRVVEKKGSGMIVDQVIEKVSFCSPDRNCDKGFAYICRDGTTRRWLCHCFLAKEDTGERLSHAVGVAFSICLERKQQREADCGVSMKYNETDGTFTKFGSFRQGTIHERIQNPQNFKPSSPPPLQKVDNPHAVARPHATDLMFKRQASFKGFSQLGGNSPFKRDAQYSSLRETNLPSNIDRKQKSRISLILEENFEDDDLKSEIDKLMVKMAAESIAKKNNNNSMTKNINTLDSKPISSSQTFPPAMPPTSLLSPPGEFPLSPTVCASPSSTTTPPTAALLSLTATVSGESTLRSTGSPGRQSASPSVLSGHLAVSMASLGSGSSPVAVIPSTSSPVLPAPLPSTSSPVLNFAPAVPVPQSVSFNNNSSTTVVVENGGPALAGGATVSDTEEDKNPWDLVPDQSKIKQHSRSNSKVEGSKENPADNWLASLTSKIGDITENNATQGFQENVEDEDLDSQFAQLANRNNMKSTNPFRAFV